MAQPADRLQDWTDEVRDNFATLGQITAAPHRFRLEGGDYVRLYIKPASKLGSALLTSRELLVLLAPFTELQARTVKAVEHCLQQSRGRLERGMAIVCHLDPAGDNRLREWGRERGLTLLPVHAVEDALPADDALQDLLCAGLYAHDPFDLAGPVRAAHQFFGRTEVPDLARRLRDGHIQALFGIRKIGKTSVLNRVLDEAKVHHQMACVVGDCSDDTLSALSPGRLMSSIAGAVNDALNFSDDGYAFLFPVASEVDLGEASRTLLHLITGATRPVLLMLDEIDYITPSSPVAPQWQEGFNPFFRALRSIYQEAARRGPGFSMMICGVSSNWFMAEAIAGVENAALAFVPDSYLPPLERPQSIIMIQALGRAAGLVFSDSSADLVAGTCSDIPYWIRKAGSYINSCFAQEGRPLTLEAPDVSGLCDEYLEVEGRQIAYASVRHLLRIFPALAPVAAVALGAPGSSLRALDQRYVSALGRYGLIGVDLQPSGAMARAGLQMWLDNDRSEMSELPMGAAASTIDSVSPGSPTAAAEDEWADLLGEVSRQRNIVERRLREFTLTVLRAHCAQRNDGKKPTDLLLAAVPLERREKFKALSSAALAKKLFLLELANVVRKNWVQFEDHFNDRKKFDLYIDIMNDRPDAHAKELDGADLALQRRAMDWVDERIELSGLL